MSESISNERLSKRNLWGYSMGGIGRDMAYQLVNTYLLTFITFTKGLSNTEFAMVGVIMVICRIFDGCNDPFMGSLIEITRTKIGKFKPWILAGVFTNVAVIIALFCVPLRGTSYLIFFAFGYLLWGMTYTMNDISYWGMLPSLTSNPGDRNNLTTLANIGAGIGAGLSVLAIPSLTQGNLAIASNASKSYAIVSIIVCIVFFVCQIMTVFVVKEKPLPKVRVDDGEKRSLKDMFKVIFKNDQLKPVMASMLLYNIGSCITMALASYWIYYRFAYQGLLVTLFTVISGVSTLVIVFFPMMCKKTFQTLDFKVVDDYDYRRISSDVRHKSYDGHKPRRGQSRLQNRRSIDSRYVHIHGTYGSVRVLRTDAVLSGAYDFGREHGRIQRIYDGNARRRRYICVPSFHGETR